MANFSSWMSTGFTLSFYWPINILKVPFTYINTKLHVYGMCVCVRFWREDVVKFYRTH